MRVHRRGFRVLDLDLRPIGVQLLSDEHRQRGPDSLAHLGMREQDGDAVIAPHTDKRIRCKTSSGCAGLQPLERREAVHPGADEADRPSPRVARAGLEESTAGTACTGVHGIPSLASTAARCTAARMRWYVPQRQRLPARAASISASLGSALAARSAAAAMICPDWQ